jgi:arylsulfatase A
MRIRAAATASFLVAASALRAPTDRPNFVIFFVDDLGYGDLGFTGHPTSQTPNLDKLAHGGKRLSTWYTAAPLCSASRTGLLTGRLPGRVGMPGVLNSLGVEGLPLNETTFADHLTKLGYATAMVRALS